MNRHWQYLKYVLRHKWYVFKAGREIGVPIITLLMHDWDKFLPSAWTAYSNTFYDSNGNSRYEPDKRFAVEWCKHQNRNKHHWQYWLLTWDRGEEECMPMPDYAIKEMIADWIGAGSAVKAKPVWEWYDANNTKLKLHGNTRSQVEQWLNWYQLMDEHRKANQDKLMKGSKK